MRPTEELTCEHENILEFIGLVKNMVAKLEAGGTADPDHLAKSLDFIQAYADRYHHAKEEDMLFPAMEEAGISRDGGPIGIMLTEHDQGRNYTRTAAEALERYRAGDAEAGMVVAANLRNYAFLLEQHIQKENMILYPMADQSLQEFAQRELRSGFDQVQRSASLGADRDRCLGHLEELRSAYGG